MKALAECFLKPEVERACAGSRRLSERRRRIDSESSTEVGEEA